ncbi:MAG: PAS domain-containing protein, partial [Calditrichota bacterium]
GRTLNPKAKTDTLFPPSTKWNNAVGKMRYSERHFLAQQPDLAEQLLNVLQQNGLHSEDIAEEIENYVFSTALTREEVCASLFLLRDACMQLLTDRPLLPKAPLEKVSANLERFIPKLAIKLENAISRSDQDTGFALTRFDPGETALELNSDFKIIAIRTGLPSQFGYAPSELTGMSFKQLFSAPSHSLLRFAESQFEEEKRMTVSLDLEAINKSGNFFPVSVQIRRFTEASRNGYDVLMQPHDHTKEARNVLNLITMALESVSEGILITEPLINGRVLFINGAMERLSGIENNEIQLNSQTLLSGNYSPGIQQNIFQSAIEKGWEGEMELLQANGNRIPVQVHKHPIRTGNKELVAIVSVVRDLQSRKAHEAKIKQQNKRLRFLQQLSEILGNNLDLMKTLNGFTEHLQKLFDHKGVDI